MCSLHYSIPSKNTTRYGSANLIIIGNIQVGVTVSVRVWFKFGLGLAYSATSVQKVGWNTITTGNIHPDVSKYNQVGRSESAEITELTVEQI